MTPMNDNIATQTIEDHKYLLELVENRAAIAYFACANRNLSLYFALRNYVKMEVELEELEEQKQANDDKKNGKVTEKKREKKA